MEILYLLIPLSVVLAFLIGGAFWWSVASGQFDDLDGPAHRILADDDGWPETSATAPASKVARGIDLHQKPDAAAHLPSAAWYRGSNSPAIGANEPKERNR